MFSAKVILDSVNPDGKRLISVECRYWRAIHSEVLTHRDRARSAMSSRAIPFIKVKKAVLNEIPVGSTIRGKGQFSEIFEGDQSPYEYIVSNCTYSMVKNDPFIPIFIGSELPGMQSGAELEAPNRQYATDVIQDLCKHSLQECKKLWELGVHKSIINRYLEPWSYISVLMTATEWKNFFRLRIHKKAEKHFNMLAQMIKQVIDASKPTSICWGGWHLPYIEDGEMPLDVRKKVSAARCARLSYLTHDGVLDVAKDLQLFDTLISADGDDNIIHAAALEHVACASQKGTGPYNGWRQFRHEFANENITG